MKNLFVSLLLSINLISCTASKCSHLKPPPTDDIKTILPVKSFVKLNTVAHIINMGADEETAKFSSASGFWIAENRVVTAAHFCDISEAMKFFSSRMIFVDHITIELETFDGHSATANVVKFDPEVDLCIIEVEQNTKNVDKVILQLSEVPPAVGEQVINIAAPLGISTTGMVPIFLGYFCGDSVAKDKKENVSMYSLPIKQGSSGSPILNGKGKLVGVVIAGVTNFQHLGFSPSYRDLKKFLEK